MVPASIFQQWPLQSRVRYNWNHLKSFEITLSHFMSPFLLVRPRWLSQGMQWQWQWRLFVCQVFELSHIKVQHLKLSHVVSFVCAEPAFSILRLVLADVAAAVAVVCLCRYCTLSEMIKAYEVLARLTCLLDGDLFGRTRGTVYHCTL